MSNVHFPHNLGTTSPLSIWWLESFIALTHSAISTWFRSSMTSEIVLILASRPKGAHCIKTHIQPSSQVTVLSSCMHILSLPAAFYAPGMIQRHGTAYAWLETKRERERERERGGEGEGGRGGGGERGRGACCESTEMSRCRAHMKELGFYLQCCRFGYTRVGMFVLLAAGTELCYRFKW